MLGRASHRAGAAPRATRPNRRIRVAEAPQTTRSNQPGDGAPRNGVNFLKTLKIVGKTIAFLALIGGLVYGGVLAHRFVVQSPHFHVRRIDVTPTVHVSAEEIRTLAKIGPRTNVFAVDLAEVARRVRRHPWVASATAQRRLPSTIRLVVKEHEVAAAVLLEGGAGGESRFYLVTAEGRAFKTAAPAELEGLPLITGVTREEYRTRPRAVSVRIREAVAAHRAYVAVPGRPRVGEVHVDPVEGTTLYTAERAVQVRLGRGGTAAKLQRLDRVLAELSGRGARPAVIRLDNERQPRRVTVRLAEAETP
jgi:cell division septal protein FtsQ